MVHKKMFDQNTISANVYCILLSSPNTFSILDVAIEKEKEKFCCIYKETTLAEIQ